jgi:UDP-N-acetylmuramate--alanine ligase
MTVRPVPFDAGPVHFVGIGGIGMSGIAEVMGILGYEVQGSDARESSNTERLKKQGVRIFVGHRAEHVEGAGVVVISSAIKGSNPEVDAARARGVPVVRRASMAASSTPTARMRAWAKATGWLSKRTKVTARSRACGRLRPS